MQNPNALTDTDTETLPTPRDIRRKRARGARRAVRTDLHMAVRALDSEVELDGPFMPDLGPLTRGGR